MKVAMLQILPCGSLEGNLNKGMESCRKAKAMGAEIALFPEMWSNGYHVPESLEKLVAESISIESGFVQAFSQLARELDMAIGITFLERYQPSPRNTLFLFNRLGNRVLSFSKVHTCDFDVERNLTPGDDFPVVELKIAEGSLKVGAMICYDREFPESARILMLKGAELILVPNACPMEINRLEQLRSRAFENMVGIVTCNYPEGQIDCNGHSTAFDGIAWLPDGGDVRDMCILKAGSQEGIYVADFDLTKMRAYREKEVFGNAYRHPRKYRQLIEEEIQEPFIRKDHRE